MKLRSKILMLGAGLLLSGLLASCMTKEEQAKADDLAQQKVECLEAGGWWGRGGILALEQCFPKYSDGGKSCNRDGDCQGMCMADTRTCSVSFSYGCLSYLNDEGKAEEICID